MQKNKAFTILELLVVVAIIAILAVIAIPNFIGNIDEAKASKELAEINAVTKAVHTYYAENGVYPTLQGKDGSLLQAQPLDGAPHNIDFSDLVPDYLVSLPSFSYWWVDYQGVVYHTDKALGTVAGSAFTPTEGYTYTLYKTNGTRQVLSAPYTLQAGEYIIGSEENGTELPKITSVYKNEKMHPEDPEYVQPVAFTTATFTNATAVGKVGPTQAQLDTAYVGTPLEGKVTSSNGIQIWTVPKAGTYRIETYGAEGGHPNSTISGKGAIMSGDFVLEDGAKLSILVGQRFTTTAVNLSNGYDFEVYNRGGGGGTFVVKESVSGAAMFDGTKITPLIVSGGGGFTISATTATNGVNGNNGVGGANGSGGTNGRYSTTYNYGSSGGGGLLTNGANNGVGYDGIAFVNSNIATSGGFGGGSSGITYSVGTYKGSPEGAGGGYSGGGGGTFVSGSGGGGGSYNIGTNQTNIVGNTGHGKVVITYVGP